MVSNKRTSVLLVGLFVCIDNGDSGKCFLSSQKVDLIFSDGIGWKSVCG